MNAERLYLKNDPELGYFIENFSSDRVVLDNYFVSTDKNIFLNQNLYTDAELSAIMHLTDKEYADLVYQYLNHHDRDLIESEFKKSQEKIQTLENQIATSRDLEEAKNQIPYLEAELSSLNKILDSVKDIQKKYEENLLSYNKLSRLKNFNLTKIHEDLVRVQNEIDSLENSFLESKAKTITSKSVVEHDKGKILFGLALGLGAIIVGVILMMLQISFSLYATTWAIGLVLAFVLVLTSKKTRDLEPENDEKHLILQQRIEELKDNKFKILNLLGLRTAEDFFNLKAQFNSYSKMLNYLSSQRNDMLGDKDYGQVENKANHLANELESLREKTQNSDLLLKPEKYLSIKRELDYLKSSSSQPNKYADYTKEEIIRKLAEIRKELSDKLPQFTEVLKKNFLNSFLNNKKDLDELTSNLGLDNIFINEKGDGYDSLTNLQKLLLQYILFKNIYRSYFAFGVFASLFSESEMQTINKLIAQISDSESKFYVMYEE